MEAAELTAASVIVTVVSEMAGPPLESSNRKIFVYLFVFVDVPS